MSAARRLWPALAVALVACTPVTTPSPTRSASPAGASASAAGTAASAIDAIKARGTIVVAIGMEAPPVQRQMGDPAHTQKRAFESAVATMVVGRVFGPNVRVEFRNTGGDRLVALEQGADLAMASVTSTIRPGILYSVPYARASVVLAAPAASGVKTVEDLSGRTVAAVQDQLGTKDLLDAALRQRGVRATLLTISGNIFAAVDAVEAGQAVALACDGVGLAVLARDRATAPPVVAELAPISYLLAYRSSLSALREPIDQALRDALTAGQITDAAAKAGFPYRAP